VISRATVNQARSLAWRSIVRQARQPAHIIPPLLFPMMLLAVNSGGLHAATKLPGFPTRSFVAFALAVPFIQGALFATMNAGTDLARDIETGFLNRLSLTPLRGAALLAGQLGGVIALGVIQACFYLVVGFAAGVRPKAGVAGVVLLLVFAALIALAFGALGAWTALLTGSEETVQSLFPVFFVFLFLSSIALPPDLLQTPWFHAVASANPVSYLDKSFQYMDSNDLFSGVIKAAVFGFLLAAIGCQQGFYTTGGAEGVGRSTTAAVVLASIAILAADFFLTKLLF